MPQNKKPRNSGGYLTSRFMRVLASSLMLNAVLPVDLLAQTTPAPVSQPAANQPFSAEQLDALLASIALYPDELLTQLLMASTFPLEVVDAARWVADPAHKSLTGDALEKALDAEPWDPSVKSLVPFPVVLATMNNNLPWLQQLGYAFSTQQADVFDSIQRLRRQAQAAGNLQSSPQQVVSTQQVTVQPPAGSSQPPTQQDVIVINPAQSDTVFVPTYNPTTVFGTWPSPAYPPFYVPPPPGYYFGTALATGLAFAAGAAVVGGLWGWARPAWGGGYANVNVNRFNNINVNRPPINSPRWGAGPGAGRPGNFARPPGGPAGLPGRSQVSVPGGAVRPPTRPGGPGGGAGIANRPGGPGGGAGIGNRPGGPGGGGIANRPGGPGGGGIANRPGGPGGGGIANRPGGPGGGGIANRPGGGAGIANRPGGPGGGGIANRPGGPGGGGGIANRPGGGAGIANRPGGPGGGGIANRPGGAIGGANRPAGPGGGQRFGGQGPGGAFGGMNNGRQAGQFGQRGAQSRSFQQRGGGFGGGAHGGGGGGFRGGGGGRGGGRGGRR